MNILVTYSHAAIPRFLNHIKTANVPAKVTNVYLKSVGFEVEQRLSPYWDL